MNENLKSVKMETKRPVVGSYVNVPKSELQKLYGAGKVVSVCKTLAHVQFQDYEDKYHLGIFGIEDIEDVIYGY
jgi:hypothetical protein